MLIKSTFVAKRQFYKVKSRGQVVDNLEVPSCIVNKHVVFDNNDNSARYSQTILLISFIMPLYSVQINLHNL